MRVFAIACVVLVLCTAAGSADVLYPAALTFEEGYGIGPPPPFPYMMFHALGSPLVMVGRVAGVGRPFDDLLPPGEYEMTYVFATTCVNVGNWDRQPCAGGDFADFRGGFLNIFLDTTPDADFTTLATFADGDMVLSAEISLIEILDDDPQEVCPMLPDEPDVISWLRFVGGRWFDRVSHEGEGFEGRSEGEMEPDVPPELYAIGYVFRADGVMNIDGPVAVSTTTWGALKALYR